MDREEEEILAATAHRAARSERSALGDHVDPDRLHAYLQERLDEPARNEIQEHLALCRECARELLVLETFLAEPEPSEVAAGIHESWQRFRSRLADGGLLSPLQAAPPGRPAWLPRLPQPVGWGLLAATLMLTISSVYLGYQARSGDTPVAQVVEADLTPVSPQRIVRTGAAPDEVLIPSSADRVLLRLNTGSFRMFMSYELELRRGWDEGGELIWSTRISTRNREGNFLIDLAAAWIVEGRYSLAVFGIDGDDAPEPIDRYRFQVRHER